MPLGEGMRSAEERGRVPLEGELPSGRSTDPCGTTVSECSAWSALGLMTC